jgi:hypothetical protein
LEANNKLSSGTHTIGLLVTIIKIANESETRTELPITLNVRGLIITGNLIGFRSYYDGIIKSVIDRVDIHDTSSKKSDEELKINLRVLMQQFRDTLPSSDEEWDKEKPNLIFLKDAQLYCDSNRPLNPPTYWIGKLESVDGFFFGRLSVKSIESF